MMLALPRRQRLKVRQNQALKRYQSRLQNRRWHPHLRHQRHECLRMRTRAAARQDSLNLFFSSYFL